jgi:hypothetical protein
MPIIVKKFSVRVGVDSYLPGDVITGLSDTEEKNLVADGYCEFPFVIDSQAESSNASDIPSIEEFAALKAAEQTALLESNDIKAGSNKEDRIQQYTDFLAGNDPLKESEEETGGEGPQTSLLI